MTYNHVHAVHVHVHVCRFLRALYGGLQLLLITNSSSLHLQPKLKTTHNQRIIRPYCHGFFTSLPLLPPGRATDSATPTNSR